MENEKKKNSCSYAVLVIILFAALAFVVDYAIIERKMNKCNCPKCEVTTNNGVKEDNIVVEDDNNEQANGNVVDINYESKGVKEFTVPFDDSRNFNSKIVNGNIQLSFDGENLTLETLNAKEMYYMEYHEGGRYILFFITEDNNLYQVSSDLYILFKGTSNVDKHIAIPILLAENVTTFLGNDHIYATNSNQAYGYPCEYISVLDVNGRAIKIFFEQQHYFGGQRNTIVK